MGRSCEKGYVKQGDGGEYDFQQDRMVVKNMWLIPFI